jgi:hypothetical protein
VDQNERETINRGRKLNMKIGIHQADGKIPNLALMRIAAYHKSQGDEVERWTGPLFPYDQVYASKIFKFTEDPNLPPGAITGGTGYANDSKLPEEMTSVDPSGGWFLHKNYKNHLGFSERGCRLNCKFCVVPEKDGKPAKAADIGDLLTNPRGEDRLVLLDDDFLGHPDVENVFLDLIGRKLRVNFICGLNIRLITERQAALLAETHFVNNSFKMKIVSFAWDQYRDQKLIIRGFNRCLDAGIKPYQMQFFVLIGFDSTPEQDRERVEKIRALGADPFVMAYDRTKPYQRKFQRWVNRRELFNSTSFENYLGGYK